MDYNDTFFRAYITCALWSTHHDDHGSLDMFDASDFTAESLAEMRAECDQFIADNHADLRFENPESCGHDFWLTRNGHGAGFWDRGMGKKGTRLTDACEAFGTCDLLLDDDTLKITHYTSKPYKP